MRFWLLLITALFWRAAAAIVRLRQMPACRIQSPLSPVLMISYKPGMVHPLSLWWYES